MKATNGQAEVVCFSVKGQVVIPRRLRREFEIEEGTRAIVVGSEEGILLKPITGLTIRRGFGLLKRKPGGKSFADEWAEHKRDERALEKAKDVRQGAR